MNVPRRLIPITRLTENSLPGRYVVITRSRTVYFVVIDLDQAFQVVRHPTSGSLLHDGEPIPGVDSFDFDTVTRRGVIGWWKDNPAHYDRPDEPYFGTLRRTSAVRFIARVWPPGEQTPSADAALFLAVAALDEGWSDEVLSQVVREAWDSELDASSVPPDVLPDPTEPADATWAQNIGACYTTTTFAAALGIDDSELSLAADKLRVLRLRTRDGIALYPAFQLQDGRVASGLQAVLRALSAGTEDTWTWAEWLNASVSMGDGSGAKRRWITELIAGREEAVLRAALQTAAAWSS